MKHKTILFSIALCFGLISIAQAQIPQVISYQGYLSDQNGAYTGTTSATLALFDGSSSVTQVWSHLYPSVTVSNGYYSILMDLSQNWTNGVADFSKQFWLEVQINGKTLNPRVQMTAAPYAMNARRADTANVALKIAHEAPIGSIVAYGGTVFNLTILHSAGWYVCDGSQISIADYPDYQTAVGQIYGVSVDGKMVNLPDLRGMFLRGVNDQRSDSIMDPDANSRIASHSGGLTGNSVGTLQMDAFAIHKHGLIPDAKIHSGPGFFAVGNTAYTIGDGPPAAWYGNTTTAGGSIETRPKNAYVYWLIKVK